MSIGLDEFDYLDESEDDKDSTPVDAPIIRGARKTDSHRAVHKIKPSEEIIEAEEPELSEEASKEKLKEEKPKSESIIFVVKVTTNKEDKALGLIADKVKKKRINIYALARPHGVRGYLFLESPDKENAEEAVFNLPYVKRLLPNTISYDEIKSMIEPVAADINIEKNDVVEIISEPFKKEKAKVVRVDKAKGEAVVSLLGAAVPIPVTVKLDNLRVIRRDEAGEEDS